MPGAFFFPFGRSHADAVCPVALGPVPLIIIAALPKLTGGPNADKYDVNAYLISLQNWGAVCVEYLASPGLCRMCDQTAIWGHFFD